MRRIWLRTSKLSACVCAEQITHAALRYTDRHYMYLYISIYIYIYIWICIHISTTRSSLSLINSMRMLYLCDVLNMRSNRKGSEKKQQITQKEEKIHNLSKNIQRKGQNKRTRTLSRQIRCRLWARTSHQDSAASKTETVGIVSAPLALRMGGGGVSKESRVIFARMQGSGKDGGESYFVSGSTQRSNSPVAHAALLIGGAVRGALFG